MRLFELEAICENYLARCRRSALKKQQRESEEEDAEAAIAEHEEDRSPAAQAKKIWARAPYIACQVALVLASTLAYPFFGLGPSLRSRAAHMLPDLDA